MDKNLKNPQEHWVPGNFYACSDSLKNDVAIAIAICGSSNS